MDRRAQGGLLLTVAVVGVLTGSHLLNPHVVTGAATAAPPPAAPTVGTCLANSVTSSWDATGTLRPAVTVYVPCDQPHRGEVFRVVDPLPAPAPGDTVFDLCTGEVDPTGYLGAEAADWQPEIDVRTTASGPDRRQVDAGQYWVACVLVDDTGPALVSALAGSAAAHTVPPQVAVCFAGSVTDLDVRSPVACDGPHDGEVFARRSVPAATPVDGLTRSCRVLVDEGSGRALAEREPDLVVEAVVTASDRVPDAATARCVVRSADDRRLTSSLRLLGDAPLPWAD